MSHRFADEDLLDQIESIDALLDEHGLDAPTFGHNDPIVRLPRERPLGAGVWEHPILPESDDGPAPAHMEPPRPPPAEALPAPDQQAPAPPAPARPDRPHRRRRVEPRAAAPREARSGKLRAGPDIFGVDPFVWQDLNKESKRRLRVFHAELRKIRRGRR